MTNTDYQQRILRDDPAKGLSSVKNAIKWKDIKETWTDPALWGLVFIGLIAYIPQNPGKQYNVRTLHGNADGWLLQSKPT